MKLNYRRTILIGLAFLSISAFWQMYDEDNNVQIDFTKWFHDLYRPNHRPYDPHETELIKRFCDLADAEFAKRNKTE